MKFLDNLFRKPAAMSAINAMLGRGQVDAALQKANELITLDPTAGEAYRVRAQIKFALKDHDGALRDIDESLTRDNHPANVAMCLTLRGMIRAQNGESSLAFADFSRAISTSPAHSNDAYTYRGQLYMQQNEIDKAFEDFSTALRFEIHTSTARRAELHRLRAECLMRLGDRAHAVEDYLKAHNYNPHNHEINVKAAEMLMERGDFGMAINVLNNALRFDPNHAGVYNQLRDRAYRASGISRPENETLAPPLRDRTRHPLSQLQDAPAPREESAPAIETPASAEITPASAFISALSVRAYQRAMQGDLHGALEDIDASLRQHPTHVRDLILRGNICFALQKYDGALASFRKAQSFSDVDNANIGLAGEALTLYTLGDVDDAKEAWQTLVARAPEYADLAATQMKLHWTDDNMAIVKTLLS